MNIKRTADQLGASNPVHMMEKSAKNSHKYKDQMNPEQLARSFFWYNVSEQFVSLTPGDFYFIIIGRAGSEVSQIDVSFNTPMAIPAVTFLVDQKDL